MLFQSIILESRVQILKTEIPNTEKSLVLLRATIQGESLKRGHQSQRYKA